MRILWVENHATFARLAGQQFLADHALTVVPSLVTAKDALAAQVFDVVLLDYDLDDGKGTTLLEHIRQLPLSLPIIATSARHDGNAALLKAGANALCS